MLKAIFYVGKRNAKKFDTYKPEYGTSIVRNKNGKLVSPLRKEEVVKSKYKFSSKAAGLELLKKITKNTGAKILPFEYVPQGTRIKKLGNNFDKLLVRSDHGNKNDFIKQRERLLQPRAVFPNTLEGKREASELIKELAADYGVLIHHKKDIHGPIVKHGRIFVNTNTGATWTYIANKDPKTDTFSRWKHELSNAEPKRKNQKQKLSKKAGEICENISRKLKSELMKSDFKDIATASFVIYKNKPNMPEFYDLLFIEGLKRPGFTPF